MNRTCDCVSCGQPTDLCVEFAFTKGRNIVKKRTYAICPACIGLQKYAVKTDANRTAYRGGIICAVLSLVCGVLTLCFAKTGFGWFLGGLLLALTVVWSIVAVHGKRRLSDNTVNIMFEEVVQRLTEQAEKDLWKTSTAEAVYPLLPQMRLESPDDLAERLHISRHLAIKLQEAAER